ncbi:MAG: HD-GYP domain-containing protein [Solirubrobacterales bacterium]|nr:HD-GYP domain-containing protein [Solirubrobacterales bacterium]
MTQGQPQIRSKAGSALTQVDSYETPGTETLLKLGRQRHVLHGRDARLFLTEASAAAAFLLAAVALAAFGSSARPFSVWPLVVTVLAYLAADRVRFQVGSAWTPPTQLVFVPMLFVLPTPFVPLIVAVCFVAGQLPQAVAGQLAPTRALARVGDSFYALGPALVLVLFGGQVFSWANWPLYLLAFLAQIVFDATAGLTRTWFAERVSPRDQLPMLWLYATDGCLSCIGLLAAAAAVEHTGLVLLTVPLIGLLWLLARERRQRLDFGLALSTAYRGTATLLGYVVEADDQYTGAHSRDVVDLSRSAAAALGLSASQRRAVEFVAMLHDVGKIFVPKDILNKQGPLDSYEWEVMRHHTVQGERILKQVGGALARVARYVRASHEHYDGHGYPDGLVGEAIPIESRIVTVCDAFSAMTTDRPYRAAMPVNEALAELRHGAGTQFDPRVVSALDRVLT